MENVAPAGNFFASGGIFFPVVVPFYIPDGPLFQRGGKVGPGGQNRKTIGRKSPAGGKRRKLLPEKVTHRRQNSPPKNKQAEALRFCLPIFNYLLLRPLPRFPAI